MVRKLFLAKIFFTDLSDYKLRPVLLIKEYKDEDFLYLPLTTNLELKGITINNDDMEKGLLKQTSVVIVPKIGILHKKFLVKEIGMVKKEIFGKVMKEFCSQFNCKEFA
ncbi:MAG: growth inhibitor PemK [Ignavibacteria bacterium]|nr:growth inhibitor PemK [Ignavibacteria bacterium]